MAYKDGGQLKFYKAKRIDNGKIIKGSLLYDQDQDCWRIVTKFFDIPRPKTEDQFGVTAPEIDYYTVEPTKNEL